jgi:hypothetical protein
VSKDRPTKIVMAGGAASLVIFGAVTAPSEFPGYCGAREMCQPLAIPQGDEPARDDAPSTPWKLERAVTTSSLAAVTLSQISFRIR